MLCWEIGRCIRQNILQDKRAAYGKEIVAAVWQQLGWTHFKSSIPIGDPVADGGSVSDNQTERKLPYTTHF